LRLRSSASWTFRKRLISIVTLQARQPLVEQASDDDFSRRTLETTARPAALSPCPAVLDARAMI
jgi:hypothetical protein